MICRVAGNIKTLAVLDAETKAHYWLTVYAQDHGVAPLTNRLEVLYNTLALYCTKVPTYPREMCTICLPKNSV